MKYAERQATRDAARKRVREFLDARATMTGPIDPEVITELWVGGERHALTVTDLNVLTHRDEVKTKPAM